ncbi:OmpA family protein [Janibacter melonis]|uniref:OmpA family protein n=1 Tax=Janibacter melonis TaxID=262209 RepID=UPI00177AE41B|nr:OmpA family protein [Janibacter melonis]
MGRPTTRLAMLAAVSLALAGCGGPDDDAATTPATAESAGETSAPPPGGATQTGTQGTGATVPEVELDEPYPATQDLARTLPQGGETLTSPDGHELTLTGVHRLADDRVVVTAVLSLAELPREDFAVNGFEEPALRRAGSRGSEWAPFELTVAGDETTYLPVRDDDERCLCSVIRSGIQEFGDAMTVMTVMSAPADADAVDLGVHGFGDVSDVEITAVPATSTTPWGTVETLTVRSAHRQDGTVTARLTLASPDDSTGWGRGVYGFTDDQLCLGGITVVGTGRTTGLAEGCVRGVLPAAGQAVDLEATMPDPGTDTLVLLPSNGVPTALQITGDAARGNGEQLVSHDARSRTEGATVAAGERVEIALDTSVLFDLGESTLTSAARRTVAVTVETLEGQAGRSLTVAGHTDSQGDAADNVELSSDRAQAVADALEQQLGDGWTFDVQGYGEEEPVAAETGTLEEVEAAQARNRRVEVTVEP